MDGSKSRLEPYDYHGGLAPMDNDNFNMEPLKHCDLFKCGKSSSKPT